MARTRLRFSASTPLGRVGLAILAATFVIDLWYLLSGNHSQTVVNIATVGVFAGMVLVWSAQYEYAWRHWLAGAVAVAGIAIGYWYFLLALGALAIAIAIVLHSPPDRRF